MKYLKLLKLLYYVDRTALEKMGQSITGDHYVSMDYGPVLSTVYDLIKRTIAEDWQTNWDKFFYTSNYAISLKLDPGDDHLCEEVEDIAREIFNKYRSVPEFTVAEKTHELPEWKDPHGSAIPIQIPELLSLLDFSSEEINEVKNQAMADARIQQVANVAS